MKIAIQRPTIGSRWFYGNFTFGILLDSHPRFFNLIIGLVLVDVVLSWRKT